MARYRFERTDDLGQVGTEISAESLFELGLIYSAGREVEPDMVTAHKWFNIAALRGIQQAKFYRMEIAREMTRAQVAEAQRQARRWLGEN